MIQTKAGSFVTRTLVTRPFAILAVLAFTLAAAICPRLPAQTGKTISILMLDAKTGKPVIPSNYMVRIDHHDAIRNDRLELNDDGSGQVTVPAGASFFSVQGTYDQSTYIYINCDAGKEKNTRALHWYSITDIMKSGVIAPNECYKGKYEQIVRVNPKPGQFVFFVRQANELDPWTD
jgi:hypothetical protein